MSNLLAILKELSTPPDDTIVNDQAVNQDIANGNIIPRTIANPDIQSGIVTPPVTQVISDQQPITEAVATNPLATVPEGLPIAIAPPVNTTTMGASIAAAQAASLTSPSPADFNFGAAPATNLPAPNTASAGASAKIFSSKNLPYIIGGAVLFLVIIVFIIAKRK